MAANSNPKPTEATMEQLKELRRKEIESFHRKFVNRPLQKYALILRNHLEMDRFFRHRAFILDKIRRDVYERIEWALQLTNLLIVLRSRPLKGKTFCITNEDDRDYLADTTQTLLLEHLDEVYEVLHDMDEIGDISDYTEKWDDALKFIPYRDIIEFEKEEYGDDKIAKDALPYLKKDLEHYLEVVQTFTIDADEDIVTRLIKKALQLKIPLNNGIFQDFYDFLDYFELIPKEQKKLHEASSDPYAARNYVRARFNRIRKEQ